MKPIDTNYLLLQFRTKIYSKNGTEFQSFFEDILEIAFSDFRKIRPYGNEGDGGNDGFRKDAGIYYQIYAPVTPKLKESEAAIKLEKDFHKLLIQWDDISKIKEYYFVFNDKYGGSVKLLEKAISILNKDHPNIKFDLFLSKDLEKLFFLLSESDILNIGFNIDSRDVISNSYKYLENAKFEYYVDNPDMALRIIENYKDIIIDINSDDLKLEFELLECRCLQKLEKVNEAKKGYEKVSKKYPKDPRAILYLAELYIRDDDLVNNKTLLDEARRIDEKHWLLHLEELMRKDALGEIISPDEVDEKNFPENKRNKANFYRLYSLFLVGHGDESIVDSFIDKAINLDTNNLLIHLAKLSILENRILLSKSDSFISQKCTELNESIKEVEDIFYNLGGIGIRSKVVLNIKKLNLLRIQEKYFEFEKLTQKTFKKILLCYFDRQIDALIIHLLAYVSLPLDGFNELLVYLKNSKKDISEGLLKVIIVQFNNFGNLVGGGKEFFQDIGNKKYLGFIDSVENNHNSAIQFLKEDEQFAIVFANTSKGFPKFREKLINSLNIDNNNKNKFLLFLYCDEERYDDAFDILKKQELKDLSYLECKPILKVVHEKKAWDFEIIILKKLLEVEVDEKIIFNLKAKLFNALFNLMDYVGTIEKGEELLEDYTGSQLLSISNWEFLLSDTIRSCFERSNIDDKYHDKAYEILEKYHPPNPSFEFMVSVEVNVFLNHNNPDKALRSLVEGVKIKKILSSEEYAKLYYVLAVQICRRVNLTLDSLKKVKENTFIKYKNNDQWYYIGNINELDAIKISNESNTFPIVIDQLVGSKILFEDKYSSRSREEVIEFIFSIEKYILWKSLNNFESLSKDNLIDGVQMVEVTHKNGSANTEYLLEFLEDLDKNSKPVFDMYCDSVLPFAMLAVSEGGVTNAIGRIQNENKGYINCISGDTEELSRQRKTVENVVDGKLPFFIDGTSALVLSEFGLLEKIFIHIPNVKTPQSVITFLVNVTEKFQNTPDRLGHMSYAQGKINVSLIDNDNYDLIRERFIESIKILESQPDNTIAISLANKDKSFSESKVPGELCDSCILAQKQGFPIMTEDYLYLTMNEMETKKNAPEYFSSLVLLRVLYEDGKVSFNEYLEYFGYLSSYRFRFLSLNLDDIEKAVFGDGNIKTVCVENIRKLNLPLTLSEEYGVPFSTAFNVVGSFLLKQLVDDTVLPEIMEKIFIEIIETFPSKVDKNELGLMFMGAFIKSVESIEKKKIIDSTTNLIQIKIDKLLKATEIYKSAGKLWLPG